MNMGFKYTEIDIFPLLRYNKNRETGRRFCPMNLQEASRIILGLRAAGWDEKSINDFILWVETGEEQYKPAGKVEKQE